MLSAFAPVDVAPITLDGVALEIFDSLKYPGSLSPTPAKEQMKLNPL